MNIKIEKLRLLTNDYDENALDIVRVYRTHIKSLVKRNA